VDGTALHALLLLFRVCEQRYRKKVIHGVPPARKAQKTHGKILADSHARQKNTWQKSCWQTAHVSADRWAPGFVDQVQGRISFACMRAVSINNF
jgi:hypothetical protein